MKIEKTLWGRCPECGKDINKYSGIYVDTRYMPEYLFPLFCQGIAEKHAYHEHCNDVWNKVCFGKLL